MGEKILFLHEYRQCRVTFLRHYLYWMRKEVEKKFSINFPACLIGIILRFEYRNEKVNVLVIKNQS